MKLVMRLLGFFFFALGFVGVFIPGLPTTIFWILAAGLFLRSHPSMAEYIFRQAIFGRAVKRFLESGSISLRGKVISSICMALGAGLGVFFLNNWFVCLLVLVAAGIGIFWVLLLPIHRDE